MTDDNNTATEAANQEKAAGPNFAVARIYLKDLSFETPQGPAAFQKQWKPKVNQDLSTKSEKIDDNTYEVSLRITVTVKDEEETIYLIEVEQAGLFNIKGIEGQQLAQVLNVTCATMLLPYARETIDSTLVKGSFPPLMIPPINFESLFASALKQSAEAQAETKTEANTH
ncbi:MAG: protein-export chaperone SecB [Porticoccaceae bacterium]|nr:protein-export chaperone SecB [Porticoccaceae bacterium]